MENRDSYTIKSTIIEVLVCVLANWGMIISGMVLGFPSSVVPPLLGSGPGLHASVDEASWVAALPFLSAPLASLLAGQLVDTLGRRRGLMLLNLTFAAGWCLVAVSPLSLIWLCVGRLLTGLGFGLSSCVAATYTAEVTSVRLRTAMVTLTPLMMSVGIVLAYLGALVYQDSWTEVSYLALGLTVLSALLTPLLPESPVWLLHRQRAEEALSSLMQLRGAQHPIQVFQEMQTFTSAHSEENHYAKRSSWTTSLRPLGRPEAFKPFIILNMFFVIQQMAGVGIVIQFAVDFTQAAGIEAQARPLAVVIALIRTLSALVTTWVCSRLGKRRPAVWSGVVLSLSLLGLAIIPLWRDVADSTSTTLATIFLLLYVFSSSVGFSALPWSMLGEIFPTDVRGVASGLTVLLISLESFLAAKLYTVLMRSIDTYFGFLFFGISGVLGTLYLYMFLPETHGKTLVEIEEHFKGTKNIVCKDSST